MLKQMVILQPCTNPQTMLSPKGPGTVTHQGHWDLTNHLRITSIRCYNKVINLLLQIEEPPCHRLAITTSRNYCSVVFWLMVFQDSRKAFWKFLSCKVSGPSVDHFVLGIAPLLHAPWKLTLSTCWTLSPYKPNCLDWVLTCTTESVFKQPPSICP